MNIKTVGRAAAGLAVLLSLSACGAQAIQGVPTAAGSPLNPGRTSASSSSSSGTALGGDAFCTALVSVVTTGAQGGIDLLNSNSTVDVDKITQQVDGQVRAALDAAIASAPPEIRGDLATILAQSGVPGTPQIGADTAAQDAAGQRLAMYMAQHCLGAGLEGLGNLKGLEELQGLDGLEILKQLQDGGTVPGLEGLEGLLPKAK